MTLRSLIPAAAGLALGALAAAAPAAAAGATLRGARGWPRIWIALFIMLANF